MNEVKGFKAFNNDATNRYGKPFIEGETYRIEGDLQFGNDGNGWHMCTALSDVFRYVNALEEDVLIAEVTGRGDYVRRDDFYYGYFDMYCFREMTVDRFLSRAEVIEKMLDSPAHEVKKFFATCRLSEEEKIMFARRFRGDVDVVKSLLYYQYGYIRIYENDGVNYEDQVRMVLKYGQDNNKGS